MSEGEITPEMQEILDRLGWKRAKARSRSLIRPNFSPHDPFIFRSKTEARVTFEKLESLIKAYSKLPLDPRELLRKRVSSMDEHLNQLIDLYEAMALERERYWESKGGPSKQWYAYKIASDLAEICYLGANEITGPGVDACTAEPNGLFSPAVRDMFKVLGVKSGWKDPVKEAIAQLDKEALNRLVSTARPVSLMSLIK